MKRRLLSGGWSQATLNSFHSAVGKLMVFGLTKNLKRSDLIPLSEELLQEWVIWAGRDGNLVEENGDDLLSNSVKNGGKIQAETIKKYINGLRCWHIFHRQPFPPENSRVINTLITASAKGDARDKEVVKRTKNPVLLKHLAMLGTAWADGDNRDRVAWTVALVAFWGMARLGELVYESVARRRVKLNHVKWNDTWTFASVGILDAKAAKPGEIQYVQISQKKSVLDPIGAMLKMVVDNGTQGDDPFFSYINDAGKRAEIPKASFILMCQKVWRDNDEETHLTGHSFRVGGASLRWNDRKNLDLIIMMGRWKSKAYQCYLKVYTKKDQAETRKVWKRLILSDEELARTTPGINDDGEFVIVDKGKKRARED